MAVIRSPGHDFDEWTRGSVISAFAFFVVIATIAICGCGKKQNSTPAIRDPHPQQEPPGKEPMKGAG